jgi:hypothetical protein
VVEAADKIYRKFGIGGVHKHLSRDFSFGVTPFNPLNAELNPICHFLALLGAHPTFHVSRIRVSMGVPCYSR